MLKRIFAVTQRGRIGDEFAVAVGRADRARDAGDHAQAAVLYQEVLDGWGPSFGMLIQRGNALKDSGAFEDAERTYLSALQLEPLDADCHLQLGHLMKLAGDMGAALQYYRDAHRLDPELADPRREIRQLEDRAAAAADAEGPDRFSPARPPARMLVETIDKGDRSKLMRERFIDGLNWRRD